MNLLSDIEIKSIYRKYTGNIKDSFMEKRHTNMMKNQSWIHKKKNNKTNRYKNSPLNFEHKDDPYKFLKIPENIREMVLNLCEKNNITLQQLAVKTNIRLHIIDNYINNNHPLDNSNLYIMLKTLNFNLCDYIAQNTK